jgi:hypothetical protein
VIRLAGLPVTGKWSNIAGLRNFKRLEVSACMGTEVDACRLLVSRAHLLEYQFIFLVIQPDPEQWLKMPKRGGVL